MEKYKPTLKHRYEKQNTKLLDWIDGLDRQISGHASAQTDS